MLFEKNENKRKEVGADPFKKKAAAECLGITPVVVLTVNW